MAGYVYIVKEHDDQTGIESALAYFSSRISAVRYLVEKGMTMFAPPGALEQRGAGKPHLTWWRPLDSADDQPTYYMTLTRRRLR